MNTYMLDTNICSFIIRERPRAVVARLENEAKNKSRIVISAVTYSELRYGAISPKAPKKVWEDISRLMLRFDAVLPIDTTLIDKGALIQKELLKAGTPIGHNDSLIAAHALMEGCILVTNNTREFVRVPGLTIEDWAEPAQPNNVRQQD